MATGLFTDYRVNLWLGDLTALWLGLHFADPNISGAYASEVFGGSYIRVLANFSTPDSRVIFNNDDVTFTGMPAVRVTHVAGWNKQYNGDMEFSVALPESKVIQAGKKFQIASATLAISLP